jgi:hypothetical protein
LRFKYIVQVASVQPSVAASPRWWLWPTILSLDAPAVVLLWQWLLSRSASVAPGAAEAIVLGTSVWLAYAADRWIEGWRLVPEAIRTHRHRFYQRRRWPTAAAWLAVLAVDLSAAFRGLTRAELLAGSLMLPAVAAYLFLHQLVHRDRRWRPPKEACVALLLGWGAAVLVASRPGAQIRAMGAPLALFVLLCFSNCALISLWEDEIDRSHGQTSLVLQFGGAAAFARLLPWAISIASAGAWIGAGGAAGAAAPCGAASGALLGLVDLAERRTGHVLSRVLADVALMTPAVPLLFRSLS